METQKKVIDERFEVVVGPVRGGYAEMIVNDLLVRLGQTIGYDIFGDWETGLAAFDNINDIDGLEEFLGGVS